jgi:hypothetical protein
MILKRKKKIFDFRKFSTAIFFSSGFSTKGKKMSSTLSNMHLGSAFRGRMTKNGGQIRICRKILDLSKQSRSKSWTCCPKTLNSEIEWLNYVSVGAISFEFFFFKSN